MLYPAELRGLEARILSAERFKLNAFSLITPKKPWISQFRERSSGRPDSCKPPLAPRSMHQLISIARMTLCSRRFCRAIFSGLVNLPSLSDAKARCARK